MFVDKISETRESPRSVSVSRYSSIKRYGVWGYES